MMKKIILFLIAIPVFTVKSQDIPAVYTNLDKDEKGIFMNLSGKTIYAEKPKDKFQWKDMYGNPAGVEKGLAFDFKYPDLNGILYYGFINYGQARYPQPVFFKRIATIEKGKTFINIKDNLTGKYDMIGWQQKGKGILGFRVINQNGDFLFDSKVAFTHEKNMFSVANTLLEGPFINMPGPYAVTISFATSMPVKSQITVNNKKYTDQKPSKNHEIEINDLQPATKYEYTLEIEPFTYTFEFETFPEPGSRRKFTFAYASDSRAGKGGGERSLFGANAYIVKKIGALASAEGAKFIQFTGDLISGYETSKQRMHLQYLNWKNVIAPFWHYIPVIAGFGNHEAYIYRFENPDTGEEYQIDQFPFKDNSAESIFRFHFVNPENGPESEDGSEYDPEPEKVNFPSYKETTFWYTYDNVAVVVLNSDYWYAPDGNAILSGNIHAFIMDNQLNWLKKTISNLEKNKHIDHIFVTLHTPFFPNGGHVDDDMWYSGNNEPRPVVSGKKYEQGIIQRRDELLDILINQSKKTLALLTGDEHNYNLLTINDNTERYPVDYQHKKLKLSRTFYQINNGAAGAPYYAREETPWMEHVKGFSTQNALVLIEVDGKKVSVRVKNPDTLELIDEYTLRE